MRPGEMGVCGGFVPALPESVALGWAVTSERPVTRGDPEDAGEPWGEPTAVRPAGDAGVTGDAGDAGVAGVAEDAWVAARWMSSPARPTSGAVSAEPLDVSSMLPTGVSLPTAAAGRTVAARGAPEASP